MYHRQYKNASGNPVCLAVLELATMVFDVTPGCIIELGTHNTTLKLLGCMKEGPMHVLWFMGNFYYYITAQN